MQWLIWITLVVVVTVAVILWIVNPCDLRTYARSWRLQDQCPRVRPLYQGQSLQNKAETSDLKPYIQRNVMAKMDLNSVKESQETIANRIEGKILREDDFETFRQFVAYDFGEKYKENKRIHYFHQINRERDTAIVSLILGSGLRLSEVAGINLEDLDMSKALVRVIRKGDKEQYVYFSKQALMDLESYLQVRASRYLPEKNEIYLFLAAPVGRKGRNRRLTQRSIEWCRVTRT